MLTAECIVHYEEHSLGRKIDEGRTGSCLCLRSTGIYLCQYSVPSLASLICS